MNEIADQKQQLRQQMRQLRQGVHQAVDHAQVAQQLISHFLALNLLAEGSVVAGYWSCGSEVSVLPLMQESYTRGYPVALPAVKAPDGPLTFRRWQPRLPLIQDCMGIPSPDDDQPILFPTILLVPLLAFDVTGARLGQGMGFYDKIIHELRAMQPIIAIGIAYDIQKVDCVPVTVEDEKLDYIITEKNIYYIQTG